MSSHHSPDSSNQPYNYENVVNRPFNLINNPEIILQNENLKPP